MELMELAEKNNLIKGSLNQLLLKKKNQLNMKRKAFAFGKAGAIKSLMVKKLEYEIGIIKNNKFYSADSLESVKEFIKLQKIFNKDFFPGILEGESIKHKGLIDEVLIIYANMEILLDNLQLKAVDLNSRGHTLEADKTTQMVSDLRHWNKLFFKQEKINYAIYMHETFKIINNDRELLEKHRGYKKILGNLFAFILTLGSAFIMNKAVTGKFLFFNKTDTINKINNIQKKIVNNAAIPSITEICRV